MAVALLIRPTVDHTLIDEATIETNGEIILNALDLGNAELSILLTDDEEMRQLNNDYRNKNRTTDVLSFPQDDDDGSEITLLGDIVISLPVAQAQAEELGHPLTKEIDRLMTHGILHLIGYDHEQGAEEEKLMHDKEDELLALLPR